MVDSSGSGLGAAKLEVVAVVVVEVALAAGTELVEDEDSEEGETAAAEALESALLAPEIVARDMLGEDGVVKEVFEGLTGLTGADLAVFKEVSSDCSLLEDVEEEEEGKGSCVLCFVA